jgi:hypothetical protein
MAGRAMISRNEQRHLFYDPTDGDKLAAREAKERARAQSDHDDPPGGIGR